MKTFILDEVSTLDPNTGCRIWKFGRMTRGYGTLRWEGRWQGAHRVSHKLFVGPIPKGANVLHRCDNPPCIEPSHLFLGTQKDNVRDMIAKQRHQFGDRHFARRHRERMPRGNDHPNAKLTRNRIAIARVMVRLGCTQRSVAAHFGVSETTLSDALHGRTWGHAA